MPDLIVEYSANLDEDLDIKKLIGFLHDRVLETKRFLLEDVRTWAVKREIVVIADKHPDNAFFNLTLRINAGLEEDIKREVSVFIFKHLSDYVSLVYEKRGMLISFDIREQDHISTFVKNNLVETINSRK